MCGIFGYVGPRTNGAELVLEGLKALEYRGYDSWGVAAVPLSFRPPSRNPKDKKWIPGQARDDKKTIIVKKKTGKIGGASVADIPASSLALGHTRWATHGGVTQVNAHPHADCSGSIALVHNGIFENYEEIKRALLKKGHRFISETDTEVAVHLIEEYAKKLAFPKAVRRAFMEMKGFNAIIAMRADKQEFVVARNGSPLVVGFGKGENFLASDPAALLPHTKNVHFLEDGEMAIVSPDNVRIIEAKTGHAVSVRIQTLTWSAGQAEKGNYSFFMLKEIYEQPGVIKMITKTGAAQADKLARTVRSSYGTYMVGCGTAAYAGIAGSYLFSKIAHRHVNCAIGSEFGYALDFLGPKSLVIALSQSGETMDLLEGVKKAKTKGARVIALVNVFGSSLYRLSDEPILIGAGPEKAVASTKAFVGILSHLVLRSFALAGEAKKGQKLLHQAAKSVDDVLGEASVKRLKALAAALKDTDHIYVIGRGLSYPASLETALKIKEISYIHAEGMAAGELKHGPLALVTQGTPCIAFLPNDETYGANLAGAMEMGARGGMIVGISYKPHEIFDHFIPVLDAGEATIIPNVVVGQLLAYYLTIEKGLDPDMPRNLAKSVTVK